MKLFNKNKLPSSEAIRYAEEQTKIYKQQVIKATNDYIRIQSNWNSLREWLEILINSNLYSLSFKEPLRNVLDKMNELERKDNVRINNSNDL